MEDGLGEQESALNAPAPAAQSENPAPKSEPDAGNAAAEVQSGSGTGSGSSEAKTDGAGQEAGAAKAAPESEEDQDVSALREWFELIGRAGFWALILYLFVFQVSVVDGPSMEPNFYTNDRLVIDKLTYRFSAVRRFDVVVFQAMDLDYPRGDRENKDYIKRVIGLPGETVVLKNGKLYIDGKLVEEPEEFNKEPVHFYTGSEEFQVPPGYFFVMGDNRGNSKDSRRAGLGFVSQYQIRGLARLRFMPLGRWKWFGRE